MANPYATVADLGAYLGDEPPADSQRLLARAQDLIDAVLFSSSYAIDSSGNPTDAGVIAAFTKATCAQTEWWIRNGDEFDQMNRYASFSIEGISATRSPDTVQHRLCDRANDALRGVLAGVATAVPTPLLPGKPTT